MELDGFNNLSWASLVLRGKFCKRSVYTAQGLILFAQTRPALSFATIKWLYNNSVQPVKGILHVTLCTLPLHTFTTGERRAASEAQQFADMTPTHMNLSCSEQDGGSISASCRYLNRANLQFFDLYFCIHNMPSTCTIMKRIKNSSANGCDLVIWVREWCYSYESRYLKRKLFCLTHFLILSGKKFVSECFAISTKNLVCDYAQWLHIKQYRLLDESCSYYYCRYTRIPAVLHPPLLGITRSFAI